MLALLSNFFPLKKVLVSTFPAELSLRPLLATAPKQSLHVLRVDSAIDSKGKRRALIIETCSDKKIDEEPKKYNARSCKELHATIAQQLDSATKRVALIKVEQCHLTKDYDYKKHDPKNPLKGIKKTGHIMGTLAKVAPNKLEPEGNTATSYNRHGFQSCYQFSQAWFNHHENLETKTYYVVADAAIMKKDANKIKKRLAAERTNAIAKYDLRHHACSHAFFRVWTGMRLPAKGFSPQTACVKVGTHFVKRFGDPLLKYSFSLALRDSGLDVKADQIDTQQTTTNVCRR